MLFRSLADGHGHRAETARRASCAADPPRSSASGAGRALATDRVASRREHSRRARHRSGGGLFRQAKYFQRQVGGGLWDGVSWLALLLPIVLYALFLLHPRR